MEIIGTILIGLVVGIVAKLLMPRDDPGGFIITTLLGIAGAFVAKYIGHALLTVAWDLAQLKSASSLYRMALEREFGFYLERQEELVSRYRGKFVVIRGCEIIGAYDDEMEAIEKTAQRFPLGSFLVAEMRAWL